MKKWNGPLKATYIELPDELHRAMRALGLQTNRKAAEVYVEAATMLLEGGIPRDYEKSSRNTTLVVSEIPDSVLDLVRTHLDDPQCLECIVALGRIWESGQEDVKDAITRNCRVFARASEVMKGLDEAGSGDKQGHEGRVGELLEVEERGDEEADDPEATDRGPRGSGGGMPRMGAQPARKIRRRG